MKKPNFFIVGAPRSGTSSMADYLRQHPQVFVARSEPHYFGNDLHRLAKKQLTRQQYLKLFRHTGDALQVGEKSVRYLYSRSAPAEIKAFSPEAKIIIQIRNPIDMVYSWHNYLVSKGREPIADFDKALLAEEERKHAARLPRTAAFLEDYLYSYLCRLTVPIARYMSVFGHDAVHVVVFDDFLSAPLAEYQRVAEFLEVDPAFAPVLEPHNAANRSKCRALSALLHDPRIRQVAHFLLPTRGRQDIARILQRWTTVTGYASSIKDETRARLATQLRPEFTILGKLIGRDLSAWSEEQGDDEPWDRKN